MPAHARRLFFILQPPLALRRSSGRLKRRDSIRRFLFCSLHRGFGHRLASWHGTATFVFRTGGSRHGEQVETRPYKNAKAKRETRPYGKGFLMRCRGKDFLMRWRGKDGGKVRLWRNGRALLQRAQRRTERGRGTPGVIVVSLLVTLSAAACFAQAEPAESAANAPIAGPVGRHGGQAPLRVAIAGLVHGHVFGFFQQYLHSPLIQIVGIEEPDHAFALRVAERYKINTDLLYTDLDEMLAKTHPQAVLTYTDTFDHRKVVETCARHHVDVMMEKPLAVSFADARAMERAARDGHIQVMVNYETTWYPSNREAYDLLHGDAIGPLRKFVARDGHSGPKEIGVGPEFLSWLTDPKLDGGGALFDFGCYGADLVTWLLDNARPMTVTAVTQHIKPDVYPRVDDEATIVVTYRKAQAIIQASWNWPFDVKDIQVFGKTGYVKTVQRDRVLVRRKGEREAQESTAKAIPLPDDDEIAYLRAVVLEGKKPEGPTSLETNMIVTEILDAARESAATGKTIRLAVR